MQEYRHHKDYPDLLIGEDGTIIKMAASSLRLSRHNVWQTFGEKILSTSYAGKGYLKITTKYQGKRRYLYLHRLVYLAFHGEIPPGFEINHKDGNKQNNHWDNLEALDRAAHAEETARQGLLPRKLTERQVLLIKAELANGDAPDIIANRHNVSRSAISHIKHGRSWSWLQNDQGVQESKG
jgi:hypothetical protein